MDKETIQYLEGKQDSFRAMYDILKQIHHMLKGDIKILESEELNKKLIENMLDRAQEFLP